MSLDPPEYIRSLQNNIRARPISWEGAVRAKTITENDLKKIKAIDKVRKDQRRQVIEGDTGGYVSLLLGGKDGTSIFESTAKRSDIMQYMLVLSGDLIDDIPSFTSALTKHAEPYKPFLPLLKQTTNREEAIPLLTSSVLSGLVSNAVLASSKSNKQLEDALRQLFDYLAGLVTNNDAGLQDIAVQEYSTVLRTSSSRKIFWEKREATLTPLFDILRTASGSSRDNDSTLWSGGSARSISETTLSGGVGLQLLYHVLLVIWQLSFEGAEVGEGLHEEQDIVLLYTYLLRLSPKEKTTRLLIGTLLNLVSSSPSVLLPAAVLARLPAALKTLQSRHLTDQDLLDDLKELQEKLDDYTAKQTTFDEYAAELETGHLRWSPPHRNPAFWTENARKILDHNQGELIKKLAAIMAKSWEQDRQVLAIGCNDVTSLVKEVPDKRSQLEKAGLKTRVMELMGNEDETVRWESLRAVGEFLRYQVE